MIAEHDERLVKAFEKMAKALENIDENGIEIYVEEKWWEWKLIKNYMIL